MSGYYWVSAVVQIVFCSLLYNFNRRSGRALQATLLCKAGNLENGIAAYEEAWKISGYLNEDNQRAIIAYNLANIYTLASSHRDLSKAEFWAWQSLKLHGKDDRIGKGTSYGQLSMIAHERFSEAQESGKLEKEIPSHFSRTVYFCLLAIETLPCHAFNERGIQHGQLGNIYSSTFDYKNALLHQQEAVRCFEGASETYNATQTRYNIALTYLESGCLDNALLYAQTALRDYSTFGDAFTDDIQRAHKLIQLIEQSLAMQGTAT